MKNKRIQCVLSRHKYSTGQNLASRASKRYILYICQNYHLGLIWPPISFWNLSVGNLSLNRRQTNSKGLWWPNWTKTAILTIHKYVSYRCPKCEIRSSGIVGMSRWNALYTGLQGFCTRNFMNCSAYRHNWKLPQKAEILCSSFASQKHYWD